MIIPKEELGHFQRWQAGSFDKKPVKPEPPPVIAEPASSELSAPPVDSPALILPTAEDIERIHEEARASGYAAGLAEGKAAGEAAMHEASELAVQQLNALIANLKQALDDLDQSVAEQLLALAIEVAGQLTRGIIAAKPDALLPIIREAIASLPLHHGHIVLRLNPEDGEQVRAQLGEEFAQTGTQIVEDTTISRGGCQLLAGASEIDGTIETRWKRVLETIGVEPQEWLNP